MFRSLSTAVLLLLFALPSVALAQNTGKLAGRVTDASTGDPLIGANVYLPAVQRGAATDVDGNYTILGIPVGEYDITYSYTGYQSQTVEGVEISQGRTRTLDIELSNETLGDVIVEYERPLIQRDAIGVPKVATGEQIQNLPVRGVASVAAIQAGVVSNEGSGTLNIRGGRGEEVSYYIDGVKVVGSVAVPQQAIAEQEMLIGTIPPQYGDATAGVISISTRSGGNEFFGALEAITSTGLDSYGYNLGSLSLGGPIVKDRVSFFLSAQGTYQEDASPYAIETLQLNDDLYDRLQASPQVIRVTRSLVPDDQAPADPFFQDDDYYYLAFPELDLDEDGVSDYVQEGGVLPADLAAALGVPVAALGAAPVPAYNLFSDPSQFTSRAGKDDPSTQFSTSGNLEFRPVTGVNLRVGGAYTFDESRGFSYGRSFFNRDRFSTAQDGVARMYASLRQVLSNTAFYQIQAEYSDRNYKQFPDEFGDDIRDILFYGDIDAPQNEVAARYLRIDEDGHFVRTFQDGSIVPADALGGTFTAPGATLVTYQKFRQQQFRVFGSAQTQVGVHELSFGGEYETLTQRSWALTGSDFTRRLASAYIDNPDDPTDVERPVLDLDGDGVNETGVSNWDELPFSVGFANPVSGVDYYGYNYLGTEEVDSQDLVAYGDRTNTNVAPYKPFYYGGYVRDRIEYRDLVIDLGLRLDVFDNNTLVLRDPYALVDIYRVSDVASGSVDDGTNTINQISDLPSNIESDYSVYVSQGNVVGYRSADGEFFDRFGEEITSNEISGNQVAKPGSNLTPGAFRDYEPALTVMPRIGVTFPVTDRALFFASYNVSSQRPSENAFETIQAYSFLRSGQGTLNNPNLRPETTTQYELGFRQRIGQQAALTLSGFYRTQRDKITLRNLNEAFPSGYTTYLNEDFTTTKGLEVAFDLRRTRNLAVNANYTLSFAEGTGSDSRTARIIAWRSQTGVFPETLAPLDFDQRHNANISLDYRLGAGEGPMVGGVHPLAGFGFNVLGVFKSGNPYTELDQQAIESPINNSTNGGALGAVNSVNMPFTTRLDLRVDRAFNLGGANLKGFLWVQNLLDADNVFGVYRTTGLPDDDGYLATDPDAVAALETELERDAYRFLYSQYVGGPVIQNSFRVGGSQLYGLPRRIRLGVTLDF